MSAYTNIIGAGWATNGVPLLPQLMGIPFGGRYIFVNAVTGTDDNEGTADSPFQSIPAAYNVMTEGKNDVLILVQAPTTAASTTGTFRLSAALTWAKSACHMIGVTAPVPEFQRCRISTATGATANINPLFTVSATGCYFANFAFFQGVGESATAEQLCLITGDRNYFANIAFTGMGSTNGAQQAASYDVTLTDGDENCFDNCTFGTETIQRNTSNANVVIASGSQRNLFRDCTFIMNTSSTGSLFATANTSNALNGSSMTFQHCRFRTLLNITGAATPAQVIAVANDVNGTVFFDECSAMASDWSTNTTGVVKTNCYVPNGNTGGLFVNPA